MTERITSSPSEQPDNLNTIANANNILTSTPDASSGTDSSNEHLSLSSQEAEIISRVEALRNSAGLLDQVRRFASDRIFAISTGAHVVSGEVETGFARMRQVYLARKKSSQERKYERYSRLAKTSAFGWRRQKFRMKSIWMGRFLQDTKGDLVDLNEKHGALVRHDEDGNIIKKERGSVQQSRKNRFKERVRNRELQRAREIEKKLLRQERIRRALGGFSLVDGSGNLRRNRDVARQHLEKTANERIARVNKMVDDSTNRWQWYRDNNSEDSLSKANPSVDLASHDDAGGGLIGQEIPFSSETTELEPEDSIQITGLGQDLYKDNELLHEAAESAAKALEDLKKLVSTGTDPKIKSLVEGFSDAYRELLSVLGDHNLGSERTDLGTGGALR